MEAEYLGKIRVSFLVLQESDENVPISRKMIEETLRNCVHLNSSSNLVGKVSDTVLQHFANLIMHEIEQKFYRKLNVLQCGGNNSEDSSHIFQCDGEKGEKVFVN